jgi:hypothetical protein
VGVSKDLKETDGVVVWNDPPEGLKDMPDVKVAWAMPTYGPIYPEVYENHLAVSSFASRYLTMHNFGKVPIIGSTNRMYLHTACNRFVRNFLESDCTHLFWTESDMLMPFWTIPALLQHDKDIASGVYFLRNGGGQPCLYQKGDAIVHTGIHSAIPVSMFPEDSTFKVHCPGMGCVLMKREVLENIEAPWFDLKEGWDKQTDKTYGYGQDIYFYSKVADAGHEVWVDSSIHCGQVYEGNISIHEYRKKIADPDFKPAGAIIGYGEGEGAVKNAEVPVG